MDTLSTKTRPLLLRPLKTTKMTKITHAKTLRAKSPVFFFYRNSTRSPIFFTNTPCKSTCLHNAPSMRTVQTGRGCLVEGCLGLPRILPDISELRFSLGNEGEEGKNLSSQTWPGSPRRSPPDIRDHPTVEFVCK